MFNVGQGVNDYILRGVCTTRKGSILLGMCWGWRVGEMLTGGATFAEPAALKRGAAFPGCSALLHPASRSFAVVSCSIQS